MGFANISAFSPPTGPQRAVLYSWGNRGMDLRHLHKFIWFGRGREFFANVVATGNTVPITRPAESHPALASVLFRK